MKNPRFKLVRTTVLSAPLILAFSTGARAQLIWDPDNDLTNNGGNGLWDVGAPSNWWDGVAASNTTWIDGSAAIFGDSEADYTVDVADGGVIVGDLAYEGTDTLWFQSLTDNLGTIFIKTGGAAWDTNGGSIRFINNQVNDTPLNIALGDTLTVNGGGLFDTGEKPNGADWVATGAFLHVTDPATVVRGSAQTIGKFDTVTMPAGSTYIHERNSPQDYNNNWVVTGTGNVTFGNRWDRISWLNGVFSGDAGLTFLNGGDEIVGYFRLNNVANSFSGGVVVDATDTETELMVTSDAALGEVPASLDAANITLRNGGILRASFAIDANRGITLDGGGAILALGDLVTVNGPVSGTGGLQVGTPDQTADRYVIMKTTNSYAGGTDILSGSLFISNDDQLGQVPASFESDNITIRNGSNLKFQNADVTLNANRGITLDAGGTLIGGSNAPAVSHVINGPITGTGPLSIGVPADNANSPITLVTPATYTGNTNIVRGVLKLGVHNAIPAASILTIGGGGTSVFDLNGYNQTIGGLAIASSNTRSVRNTGASTSTLTIDVEAAASYFYSANLDGTATVNLVKNGLGTQTFNRVNYTTDPGEVTVNAGTLNWFVNDNYGAISVNGSATLGLDRTGTAASFTAAGGSTINYNVAITDWTGAPGTDWPLITVSGDLSTAVGSNFNVIVTDGITNFTEVTKSFVIGTVGGTPAPLGTFSVDDSGFTAGTGTWSLGVIGSDLVLTYNVGADPYATWATSKSLTAPNAGKNDDKDNDGIENQLEWVLGGNPLISDTNILPTVEKSGGNLVFTFNRADDTIGNVDLVVQFGSDLAGWSDETVPAATSGIFTINDNGATDEVIATIPVGAAAIRFVRLKSTSP